MNLEETATTARYLGAWGNIMSEPTDAADVPGDESNVKEVEPIGCIWNDI